METLQRNPVEIIISVLVNWVIGLAPALFMRFVVLRKPMEKKPAIWLTIGIGVVLFLLVSLNGGDC